MEGTEEPEERSRTARVAELLGFRNVWLNGEVIYTADKDNSKPAIVIHDELHEGGAMKIYKLENGNTLFDINKAVLLELPVKYEDRWIQRFECGGFKLGGTKKGRPIIRVLEGFGHVLTLMRFDGDRAWGGYDDFEAELGHSMTAGYSTAVADSNGGGCWIEVHIYPADIERDFYGRPTLTNFSEELVHSL